MELSGLLYTRVERNAGVWLGSERGSEKISPWPCRESNPRYPTLSFSGSCF